MTWARRKAARARRAAPLKHKQAIRNEREGKEAKGSSHKTGGGGPVKPARSR